MIDAATKVWVCEEGHVDDHHYHAGWLATIEPCSRCGGHCEEMSLDGLAREYRRLGRTVVLERMEHGGRVGDRSPLRKLLSQVKQHRNATESRLRMLNGREALDTMLAPDRDLYLAADRVEGELAEQQGEVGE